MKKLQKDDDDTRGSLKKCWMIRKQNEKINDHFTGQNFSSASVVEDEVINTKEKNYHLEI